MFAQLRHVFPTPAHVCLSGVRNGTGYERSQNRTADGLILSVWPSRGLWVAGVEIKVSRSDWKKELANPEKSHEIQRFCDYWYIAAPKGIVPVNEVPKTWGVIECSGNTAAIVRDAPKLTPAKPDMLMVCSILRNFADGMVPRCDFETELKERLAKAEADIEYRAKSRTEDLLNAVNEFEKASGISIRNRWASGRIGELVKQILDLQIKDPQALLSYYRQQAIESRRRLDEFISALDTPTAPAVNEVEKLTFEELMT